MDSPGTVDTAKNEASNLKHTAVDEGKNVVDTAKHEASAVLGEAKMQAKDLYAQTQREVRDQASTQQRRVAEGLRSAGDELESMAANSSDPGMATDLVRQVSSRLSAASNWLDDRDPAALLHEVKSFARRKPGMFILGAVVLGVVAGRLTRALAANASDEHDTAPSITTGTEPDAWVAQPAGGDGMMETGLDTPIYAQSTADWADAPDTEDGNVRHNTV